MYVRRAGRWRCGAAGPVAFKTGCHRDLAGPGPRICSLTVSIYRVGLPAPAAPPPQSMDEYRKRSTAEGYPRTANRIAAVSTVIAVISVVVTVIALLID